MKKNDKKEEGKLKIYPKPDKIGWIINVCGLARFQPATKDDYILLPAKHKDIISKCGDVIVKEVENG